jgi:hypothetical protein
MDHADFHPSAKLAKLLLRDELVSYLVIDWSAIEALLSIRTLVIPAPHVLVPVVWGS